MIDENTLHRMSRRIENASEGITIQIEKKAESAGNPNAYIYLIMDAQSNIQNVAFVSALYLVTKNVYERTTCCIVHSSNRSRKNTFSIEFTRKRIQNYFDFIIIICPTLKRNETYRSRKWVWTDPEVILIEPGNQLYYWTEKIGNLLAGSKTLLLIDDIIANENLDKRRRPLLELAISGRSICYGC